MPFTVTTAGPNRIGLAETCRAFVNDLWIPDYLTPEEAAAFALDCFRRAVMGELELLELHPGPNQATGPGQP